MLNSIASFPIVILSAPRTGSTLLIDYLSKYYDLVRFREPDYGNDARKMTEFTKFAEKNSNYIVKFHSYFAFKYDQNLIRTYFYGPNLTRIRIRRKNFIHQCASHYLAMQRQEWHYQVNQPYAHSQEVIINIDRIVDSIKVLKRFNHCIDNLNLQYKLDLMYEELPDIFNDCIPTPKPDNYEILLRTVQTLINNV